MDLISFVNGFENAMHSSSLAFDKTSIVALDWDECDPHDFY